MVQLTPSRLRGAINIESILEVNEGFVQRLKNHESKVQALERDLNVRHILSTDENGNIISKVGKMYNYERDAVEQLTIVQQAHEKFIHTVEQWELSKHPARPADEEQEQHQECQQEQLKEDVQECHILKTGNKIYMDGNMPIINVFSYVLEAIVCMKIRNNERPE